MPLRVLSYDDRLWQHHRDKQRGAALPPIIAVVVSHVPGGWTVSPHFAEMFDRRVLATIGLAALVPQFSLIIFDLARQTDAQLKALSLPVCRTCVSHVDMLCANLLETAGLLAVAVAGQLDWSRWRPPFRRSGAIHLPRASGAQRFPRAPIVAVAGSRHGRDSASIW